MEKLAQAVPQKALSVFLSLIVIGAITLAYARVFTVNATTVSLTYFLAVLGIATRWGLLEAVIASVGGVLCINFFFLPPVGSLTISDPQNWVALFVFLVTAVIASHLSSGAKARAEEAILRQHEMERLYALSRNLLLADSHTELAKQVAQQIAQISESSDVAFYDRSSDRVYRAGPRDIPVDDAKMRDAAVQGTVFHDAATNTTIIPIRLGHQPIGSLAIHGTTLSETALHSMANLAAIALERARAQEKANRAEAARQGEELKSTMLDALSHEFKTPLTPIKAAVTSMLADSSCDATHQELLHIIDEETDRLNTMLTEAIQMASIEAGKLQMHIGPHPVDQLIRPTLEKLAPALETRPVKVMIPQDLPAVKADPEPVGVVIWQFLSNAIRYTPPGAPLTICARLDGDSVVISVADCGPGVPEKEQDRIFEKFYRGREHRERIPGTGMGLAIAREIVQAHGGKIWVQSKPGQGAEFFFSLPTASKESVP